MVMISLFALTFLPKAPSELKLYNTNKSKSRECGFIILLCNLKGLRGHVEKSSLVHEM